MGPRCSFRAVSDVYEEYGLVTCPCGRRVQMSPALVLPRLRRGARLHCMVCGSREARFDAHAQAGPAGS